MAAVSTRRRGSARFTAQRRLCWHAVSVALVARRRIELAALEPVAVDASSRHHPGVTATPRGTNTLEPETRDYLSACKALASRKEGSPGGRPPAARRERSPRRLYDRFKPGLDIGTCQRACRSSPLSGPSHSAEKGRTAGAAPPASPRPRTRVGAVTRRRAAHWEAPGGGPAPNSDVPRRRTRPLDAGPRQHRKGRAGALAQQFGRGRRLA